MYRTGMTEDTSLYYALSNPRVLPVQEKYRRGLGSIGVVRI